MTCSDESRERRDPMIGTAAPARRWLLIEHPGPWRPDAFASSGIDPDVQQRLNQAAFHAGARILLIRRPGRQSVGPSRSWAVLSYDGSRVWGRWSADHDLLSAADALGRPATGDPDHEMVLLVCAHGLHDVCCAVRGRPVAAALQKHWPDNTWETSHVGGDRFAANLIVLPDGFYYGNLDAESAVDTVRAHRAGAIETSTLRGTSIHRPQAQAAVGAVHARYGPMGPRAVEVTHALQADDGSWLIDLMIMTDSSEPAPQFRARVVSRSVGTAPLTCRATGDSHVMDHRVVDLGPISPAPSPG